MQLVNPGPSVQVTKSLSLVMTGTHSKIIVTWFLFLLEELTFSLAPAAALGARVHWKWLGNKEAADPAACFPVMRFTVQYIMCLKKTS